VHLFIFCATGQTTLQEKKVWVLLVTCSNNEKDTTLFIGPEVDAASSWKMTMNGIRTYTRYYTRKRKSRQPYTVEACEHMVQAPLLV